MPSHLFSKFFLNRISCTFNFLLFILLFLFLPQPIKISFDDLHIHDFFPFFTSFEFILYFSHILSQLPLFLSVSRYLPLFQSLTLTPSVIPSLSHVQLPSFKFTIPGIIRTPRSIFICIYYRGKRSRHRQ